MAQTQYLRGPKPQHATTRGEIQALNSIGSGLYTGCIYDGKLLFVDVYLDPNTGRGYEIQATSGSRYRVTEVPTHPEQVLKFGEWQALTG